MSRIRVTAIAIIASLLAYKFVVLLGTLLIESLEFYALLDRDLASVICWR